MSWSAAWILTLITGLLTWYLLRKKRASPSPPPDITESLGQLHIYVGTQTGHSMHLASILAEEAREFHFHPHIVNLENFQILEFKKHDYCVIICSTQSDGNPPESAVKFTKWLTKTAIASNENLSSLSYSVFGLTKTDQNNATARKINAALSKLGAVELIKIGECEESCRTVFKEWTRELWKILPNLAKTSRRPKVKDADYLDVTLQVPLGTTNSKVMYVEATSTFLASKEKKIVKMKELKRDPECSALSVEIETNEPYETGGKIGIFPENEEEIVRDIAALQGYDLELSFQFNSAKSLHPFPTPITVREALAKYCDLTTLVRKKTLKKLSQFASSPEEKSKLEFLSSLKGKDEFKRKLVEPMLTVAELFKLFPSIKVPVTILVQILDRIEPRFYNISSSAQLSPSKVQIAVEVLRERTCEGKTRTGLCSGFLEKLYVTGLYRNIRCFFQHSKFRIPPAPAVIHMICNRCGIAAFKGMLQEMQKNVENDKSLYSVTVYLGCKSKSTQFIYKQDIEKLIKPQTASNEFTYAPEKISEGPHIIETFYAAFSRDQTQKKYVKDILSIQQEVLWEDIYEKHAYVFVCGSRSLGKSVKECISNIANEHLGDLAVKYLEGLTNQGRFIEEVWD
jgi:NADPH-ferrihemoprotein reductase